MSLPVQLLSRVWRTGELRELLEDEEKINHIVRCSEKLQRLQQAAKKMLVSNQKLAKANLSQKPKFRDAKLLLASKYKELDKLRRIIEAKQEQLAEKHSVHYAQWCLLKKLNHAEEEFELLFQRFAEGKTALADFVESFLSSQKLHHVRLVLVKKLQEILRHERNTTQRLREVHVETQSFSVGFPEQTHPLCSLTTAVFLPACCHPPFLLPLCAHVNVAHLCSDDDEHRHSGWHGRGLRWPVRPGRLQPLKVQQRRHQHQQQ